MTSSLNGHESGIQIDTVILTHRHYDHVGGVMDVLSLFPKARVLKCPSPHDRRNAYRNFMTPLFGGERISVGWQHYP